MTSSPRRARTAGELLVTLLLAVQAIRFLASVVGGIATWRQRTDFGPPGRFHVGEILASFGAYGDGVGVLLLVVAVVMLWFARLTPAHQAGTPAVWQTDPLRWLLALTAVGAAVGTLGVALEVSVTGLPIGARLVAEVGFQSSYIVLALGAMVALRRVDAIDASTVDPDESTDAPAAVFAVDRRTGDVHAWASRAEARAKAPLYGVEDDEFDWYLDDGAVLRATADGRDVVFTPTGGERPDDLLRHLKEYAVRRGITVDEEESDEPLAYVEPIARDHYLEMWPGWLRWLGHLTR
ncbi:MAG TPA: hypothetical protein VFH66_12715 [Mycobacteriales bacterium]|nr:hypothetical protein [Mycobacteriales bacterium]